MFFGGEGPSDYIGDFAAYGDLEGLTIGMPDGFPEIVDASRKKIALANRPPDYPIVSARLHPTRCIHRENPDFGVDIHFHRQVIELPRVQARRAETSG